MKIKNFLLGAALALGFTSTANASLIIDDFSTSQGPISVMQGDSLFSSVLGNMLGGERDLQITSFVDDFNQGASVNVASSNFFFSSGSGNESEFVIQWDGIDNSMAINPFGLGGLDFTDLVSELPFSFITHVIESDLNAWFSVTFWSGEQGIAETVELPIPGISFPGRDAFFTTSEFTNTDFTNIGAIEVRGNIISPETGDRQRSYDLQLAGVTAVPEPAPIALLAAGLLGISLMARRRKTSEC